MMWRRAVTSNHSKQLFEGHFLSFLSAPSRNHNRFLSGSFFTLERGSSLSFITKQNDLVQMRCERYRKRNIFTSRFYSKESFGTIAGSSDAVATTANNPVQQENLKLKESSTRKTTARPTYAAIEITSDGAIKAVRLTLPEILRKSSLHVRDLFSLALTEVEDEVKRYDENKAAKERLYRMHLDAILPRENEIIVRATLEFPYISLMALSISRKQCIEHLAIVWLY